MAPRAGRAAIVSTMRAPGASVLAAWLAYHRAIGFRRFFLYFDDPDDPDLAAATGADVTAIRCDPAFVRGLARHSEWARYGEFAANGHGVDRLIARQVLHVQDALAQIEGDRLPIDWLLHIDHDELFLTPGDDAAAHFAALAALGTDQAIYLNHEAVPESLEVGDPFRDVTLFRRNPFVVRRLRGDAAARTGERGFLAYTKGKAAVRVGIGAAPAGCHSFRRAEPPLRTRMLEVPCILHYPACGFARWRLKYQQLGAFSDRWFGGEPIHLSFHVRSRDVNQAGSDPEARAFYRRHAMVSGSRRERLAKRGILVRIRRPARLLARLARHHHVKRLRRSRR